MAKFVNITLPEMESFLKEKGFQQIYLNNTVELVFAKIFHTDDGKQVSMRVFTGIEPNGNSRKVGSDAIRVHLFWKDSQDNIIEVGGSKRVHRVEGWKKNLSERINHWKEMLGPICPKCNAPMVERAVRSGANKGQTFYGCCMFFKTGCTGTLNTAPVRK